MASTVALAACSASDSAQTQETPEGSVNGLISAIKNIDEGNTNKHFIPDSDYVSEGNFMVLDDEERKEMKMVSSLKKYTSNTEHKIKEVKEDGETAVVNLEITYSPAVEPISSASGELIGLAFSSMGKEISEDEMEKQADEILVRYLDSYEKKTEKASGTITLAKKDNLWYIEEIDDAILEALSLGLSSFSELDEEIEMEIGEFEIGDFEVTDLNE